MDIIGKWKKTSNTECSNRYPETIEFKVNGIYTGELSSNSKFHPVWDVGSFHLKGKFISMSTSNDSVIDYPVESADNIISFKDAAGCMIAYTRI